MATLVQNMDPETYITGASWDTGVATIHTYDSRYVIGQRITLSETVPDEYNGDYIITGVDNDLFIDEQTLTLTLFEVGDHFHITWRTYETGALTYGSCTAAAIKSALEAIATGTVTVAGVQDVGPFTIQFTERAGFLAGLCSFTNPGGGCTGSIAQNTIGRTKQEITFELEEDPGEYVSGGLVKLGWYDQWYDLASGVVQPQPDEDGLVIPGLLMRGWWSKP